MSNLKKAFPSSASIREAHEVITNTDAATGTVTREAWYKDGELDRADGPASIERDAATGTVTYEAWWKDSKRNRADGPAFIERDAATGTVTYEEWWKDGEPFKPSAELRAAWLKNEAQQNFERIAQLAASFAPVPPAPM
jgi:hypothetical protein